MLNKFKFAAVALAALVATATFTASTEQAQAAKLSTGARVAIGIGVGAALLTGAALANRHHADGQVYYENRRRGDRYDYVSDDEDEGPRYSSRRKRTFDRYDD
jgi:hypothetical protein